MTKLHNPTLFSEKEFRSFRWNKFSKTELGQLYQTIPFKELAGLLPKKKSKAGAPGWFSYEGYFGLMLLKSYLNLSDSKLIDRINTDWALQMFCGIQLKENEIIRDEDIPSRVRKFLGEHIQIEQFQKILINHWKPYIEYSHCMLNDATAYESYIKYPTDVKILWDCCVWVYESLFTFCKTVSVRRPRNKYLDQQLKQNSYQKQRKKTYQQTRKRKKALLYLLNKAINQLDAFLEVNNQKVALNVSGKFYNRLSVIRTILSQQQQLYDHPQESVQGRIVSLFKPYLRSIVRGKETKKVEFGAKAMISQVDGINIIDRLSFDPYNESTYLENSILKHKIRFGNLSQVGIDQIYGTNYNRSLMKTNNMYHCLVRKGKPSQYEKQAQLLRRELGKQRATVLEGSFGNEKNHYGLTKVKARLKETEVIWILFGVWTANAVKIKRRKYKKSQSQAA